MHPIEQKEEEKPGIITVVVHQTEIELAKMLSKLRKKKHLENIFADDKLFREEIKRIEDKVSELSGEDRKYLVFFNAYRMKKAQLVTEVKNVVHGS